MDPASRLTSAAKTLYQNIAGGQLMVAPPESESTPQAAQPTPPPSASNQPQPDSPPAASPSDTLADGQFSPEELEYLRQNGQLPPGMAYGSPLQESSLIPGVYKPMPEEVLLEWIAPSRPFKKPKRVYFVNVTVIGILICLILFFANQFFVAAVVLALVFLVYVLNSISPKDVRHALTTYGIRNEDQLYYWEELGRFWITQSKGQNVLHIEVARFPNRLSILLGEIPADDMTVILSEVLLNEKPPLTQIERWGEWLKQKVPLDLEN